MTENTKLWDILGRTDPAHTKSFTRGGGFKGTAIKPMWSYRRMTEEFGPCGEGWGVGEPLFQVVNGDNREILVYCTASIWYGPERKTVFGVGGDKIVTHIKANAQYSRPERWENDDEAFKKAFTDAITNALKMIGVGADVHMGMFDDNKYVNTMREEFSDGATSTTPNTVTGPALKPPSAASLKRADVWSEMEREIAECSTDLALSKLRWTWGRKAVADKWPLSWMDAAADTFDAAKKRLPPPIDDDVFPGDRPTGAVANMMAG